MFHASCSMNHGFTLIEMIVVVSMVALLATVSVVSFRSSQQDDYLNVGAQRIQDALRIAQNDAQTGVISGYEGARAFGVRVDTAAGTAVIFADTFGTSIGVWDTETTPPDPATGDITLKEMNQPISVDVEGKGSVIIESITVAGSAAQNSVDLAFRTITTATLIDGADTAQSVAIKLKNNRNDHTKTVTLYRLSGRIDLE